VECEIAPVRCTTQRRVEGAYAPKEVGDYSSASAGMLFNERFFISYITDCARITSAPLHPRPRDLPCQ
jgi:hypothetical protein